MELKLHPTDVESVPKFTVSQFAFSGAEWTFVLAESLEKIVELKRQSESCRVLSDTKSEFLELRFKYARLWQYPGRVATG